MAVYIGLLTGKTSVLQLLFRLACERRPIFGCRQNHPESLNATFGVGELLSGSVDISEVLIDQYPGFWMIFLFWSISLWG